MPRKARLTAVVAAAAATFAMTAIAVADEAKLPSVLVWTAYGTGSSGNAQSVAIGNMLKNRYGTSLRVLPGKNDVSRMTPLRDGKADFCACGIASFFGQEGAMLFAKPNWGPQPLRLLMTSIGSFGLGVATAKDANIRTPADLKGKRVAWVRAGDALNVGTTAYLAFGGLGWNDVKKVEFGGFTDSAKGLINDQVDAAFMSTVTPYAKQLAASPRGIRWPVLAHDDDAAWARFLKVAPYFIRHKVTAGAGISKDKPWEGSGYSYPILVTNASYDARTVYALVKALHVGYDDYKDAAPGAKGWAMSSQNFTWVMPYHKGAIRYFKEIGVWTDAMQAHNDRLLKRQAVLAEAWRGVKGSGLEGAAFKAAWMKARSAALEKAGFDPIFK